MKPRYLIHLILLTFILAGLVHGQKAKLRYLGLQAGVTLPNADWDPGFAVKAQADLGEFVKYVFLVPHVMITQNKHSLTYNDQDYELSMFQLHAGADLIGFLNPKPRGLYGGPSFGFNTIFYDTFLQEREELSEKTEYRIGFGLVAGYLLELRKIAIQAELRYTIMNGGFNVLMFTTGVSYEM